MVVESFHLLDSSSDSDSSEQSTSTRSSDASSSNHMEHNSESCAAQTDNLKELIGTLTRERSIKGLTRMCSSKYRRKGAKVPNYLKATKCSVVRKLNLQASSPNLNTAASPRNKPLSVLRRTTTLRPKRRLAKLVSLRPRRPSMKSCSEVSPSMGSGVQRATCSSTYKNSKFPALIGIQPGDDVSVVSPAAKVCSFSYCTLHGNRHTAAPSLKRLKSARKRVRTQRSKKLGGRCEIGAQGLLLHNSTKDVEEKDIARNESRHCSPIGSAESTGKPDASRSRGEMPQAVIALSGDGEEMMDKLLCVDEVSHIESTTAIQLNAAREDVASESDSSNGDSVKASFGRRKLTGLWRLIHQQVVSDVAENGGLEFPVHRLSTKEEEKEDGYDWAATPDEAGQQEELRETDAIKLVRDAITRILAQSQTSSSNEGIVLEKAATREVNSEGTISPDVEEEQLSVDKMPNINKKPIIDAVKKPNPLVSKRWSNVKNYVMMRRFITVMEKMRTFKPRIPRSLSSEEYHEQERVSLRHQSIEERKNSEEWMLDYALRKVVSELEPAQKRKVALLVHAFEIVNPVPGSGSRLKPTGSYASISEESPSSEDGDFSEISNGEVQKSKKSQTSTLEHSISEDIGMENGVISKDVEEDHRKVYIANNTNNGGYLEEVQQVVEIVQGFRDEEGQGMDQATLLDSALSSELLSSVESIGDSVKASLGTRKFSGLWNMIHQQMVSEVAENGGLVSPASQLSIKEPEEDSKKLPETNGSGYNSTSDTSGAATPEEAIQQTDVIKLLREAVNKILEQTEKQSLARQTSNQLVSKRWSNVKKYVLMRRFIKSMEKMRTLRPRIPRSPSSEVYAKQEKVSLRSQSIGERKNSEEWMLDYALRKVISELDPPQQRKVGLLVQAFEKVSPFPGREAQIKPSVQNASEIGIENRDSAKTGLIMETQHEGGEAIGSHPSPAVGDGPGSGSEKEDGLWSLIYKRMASGLESEGATQPSLPIFDGDKGENKEEKGMESEGITQSKLEAIKLVQQAIDEILLPDFADSSIDDQDTSKGTVPEKGPENKGCSKEARHLSVGENINDQFVQSTPDSQLESYGAAKLEGNAANHQEVTRSVTPAGKNWNNLRKAILLKRFVKALEKVRTFNPQQPRYLPLELDEDPERVNLRRQESENRKNGEAYLLDYALQQVVSKLTPARKKKVHLLVEAFETITPHLGK